MITMLILFIFILFLVITIFYILRQSRYKNLANFILVSFIIVTILVFNLNNIDEKLYSKSDIKNDLALLNITLNDDFEIKSNKVDGFPERYQKTILKVSNNDKKNIIEEIKKFNPKISDKYRLLFYKMNDSASSSHILNYINSQNYIREYYFKDKKYIAKNLTLIVNETNFIELNNFED